MNDETGNNKQKSSPKPIRIVDVKPEEILLRKRYNNESAKEYKYFLKKLGKYEADIELYKIFLDNEEYKKVHGVDKPTGKQYISFQAPIEIFNAFKAQTETDDCTQVSAFVKFMDQYGKGKQVKFADQIKNLEDEVKKLKKELVKNSEPTCKNTGELEQQVLSLTAKNDERLAKHLETKKQLQVFIDYAIVQGKTLEEFTLVIKQKIKESNEAKTEWKLISLEIK